MVLWKFEHNFEQIETPTAHIINDVTSSFKKTLIGREWGEKNWIFVLIGRKNR